MRVAWKALLSSRPAGYWAWCAGMAALFLLLCVFTLRVMGVGVGEKEQALETGQRYVLELSSGLIVEGRKEPPAEPPTESQEAAEAPKPPPGDDTPDAGTADAPAEDAPPATEATDAQPAPAETPPSAEAVASAETAPPAADVSTEPETPAATEQAPAESPPVEAATPQPQAEEPSAIDANSLAAAPGPGLVEQSEVGNLPMVSVQGVKPAHYYAKPFAAPASNIPMVALVISGMGANANAAEAALALPDTVTLSFSPYAANAPALAKKAREAGHEVWIDLPMEKLDYPATDPGPQALLSTQPTAENLKRLHWTLSRFPGFVGVFAPAQEKLSANKDAVQPLIDDLAKRGVAILTSLSNRAVAALAPQEMLVTADMEIADAAGKETVLQQLKALEALAKKHGHAAAIIAPYPSTLAALGEWAKGTQERGIVLAPLSALTAKKP